MPEASIIEQQKIEQYKSYLQDLSSIGTRHETARGFYLSILTALLAFLALAGNDGPLHNIGSHLFIVIGVGAIAICALWFLHTLSFAALYQAKIKRLKAMEETLPFRNFAAEYDDLLQDWRYVRLTTVERWVAFVFVILFAVTLALV